MTQPITRAQPAYGQQPVAPGWYTDPQPVMVPWQVPSPAPGRRYGLGVVVTVGIVAAVLAGAVGLFAGATLKPGGGHPVAAAAAGTPGETSTPDGSTLADGRALLAQVAEPPAGATAVPVIGSTGGVMDIDQFVAKFFTNPDAAKASLSNDNFKVAAQRNWMDSDGVEVEDQLVEFASETDAQRYVTRQNELFQADEDIVATFEIPNVALGNGYERKSLDSAGNRRTTLIAADSFYAVVLFFHTPHDFDRTAEIAAMQAQLNKIQ
jgi:hypothetical protein